MRDCPPVAGADRSPIALFVYNRPEHTMRTLAALQSNAGASFSDLIVFSDGPRTSADVAAVNEIREKIKKTTGFKTLRIIERQKNIGLAESIISGVSEVLAEHETVIVLEDDLVTSPFFLEYMNDALTLYRDEARVASIVGYCFPSRTPLPETFFLQGADCWGWATWRRGWRHFERDGKKLLAELESRHLGHEFDLRGSIEYMKMLRDQIEGKNSSWAIRWRAAVHLKGLLSLYPGRSLVENIGLDGTGVHCSETDSYRVSLADSPVIPRRIPVMQDDRALDQLIRFYRDMRFNIPRRALRYLRKTWKRFAMSSG